MNNDKQPELRYKIVKALLPYIEGEMDLKRTLAQVNAVFRQPITDDLLLPIAQKCEDLEKNFSEGKITEDQAKEAICEILDQITSRFL